MSAAEQQQAGCVIGRDYLAPIVEHAAQRVQALALFKSAVPPHVAGQNAIQGVAAQLVAGFANISGGCLEMLPGIGAAALLLPSLLSFNALFGRMPRHLTDRKTPNPCVPHPPKWVGVNHS